MTWPGITPDPSDRPAFFRDRQPRQPVTWPQVALLAVVFAGLVGVAFACAWGVRG